MQKLTRYAVASLITVMTFALVVPSKSYAQAAQGQQGDSGQDKGEKRRGTGTDENIKSKSVQNNPSPEAAPEAPPEKGGKKERQSVCSLHVDNRTPWKVQIYVDGDYVGLVSPYGDAYGTYGGGRLAVYAVAEFVGGSELTWGPRTISCNGRYTWTVNQ